MQEKTPHAWISAIAVFTIILACSVFAVVLIGKISTPVRAQTSSSHKNTDGRLIARGKYIVNDVAMCGQCHTPRTSSGELERGKWLDGAALWIEPATPTSNWPLKAPRLAGNPPASDNDLITLLTTGAWPNGSRLRPPMPQFHMTHDDAEAVVAYLRSLTPHSEDAP
jgi:mono/diheme cytochrome c family protein